MHPPQCLNEKYATAWAKFMSWGANSWLIQYKTEKLCVNENFVLSTVKLGHRPVCALSGSICLFFFFFSYFFLFFVKAINHAWKRGSGSQGGVNFFIYDDLLASTGEGLVFHFCPGLCLRVGGCTVTFILPLISLHHVRSPFPNLLVAPPRFTSIKCKFLNYSLHFIHLKLVMDVPALSLKSLSTPVPLILLFSTRPTLWPAEITIDRKFIFCWL